MLLEKLSIENYGVYGGKNDFDLSTTPDRPVILVGGYNGAGKTTILESMMIALYGRDYLGRKKPKKEYVEFVLNRMHRNNGKRAGSASIELSFRFHRGGAEDKYAIRRSWTADGASVSESFLVQMNGRPMDDVDESQWQSFIEGMLPLGIAKLFFLDGEKIVQVTEKNGQYNDEIKTSLEMLLGAEFIRRLRADLNLYMLRWSGKQGDEFGKEYERMNAEKDQTASEIELLMDESDRKKAQIDEVNDRITQKESAVSGIGGGYADMRGDLLTKKAVLSEKMVHSRRQIHDSLAEDAPFHLIPSLLDRLSEHVKADAETMKRRFELDVERQITSKIRQKLSEPGFWPDGTDAGLMSAKIFDAIGGLYGEKADVPLFGLSPDDSAKISQSIEDMTKNSKSLLDMIERYAGIVEQIEKIESDLSKIPRDDELGPKISEINSLHQEVGMLKAEIAHIEQQVSSKRSYKKILQNRLKKMIEAIHRNENASAGVLLASKMQKVLDTYYANLKERKIAELESNLLDTVRLLLHKDFISRIRIDRDSFEIRAYVGDEPMQIDTLSMGERQIIGTALLWAIARTSGRALPFVIDTPLGRLDGMHRDNLTERFYPSASHQTILLSTDKEIGHTEYEDMRDLVSRSYRITYDHDRSNTGVTPGYFMEEGIAPA